MVPIRVEAVSLGRSDQSSGFAIVFLNDGKYIVRESESFGHASEEAAQGGMLRWLQRTQQYHQAISQVINVTEMGDEMTSLITMHNPHVVPMAVGSQPPLRKTESGTVVVPQTHLFRLVQRLHEHKQIRIPRHHFETQEWLDACLEREEASYDGWDDDGRLMALALACWYCWYEKTTAA